MTVITVFRSLQDPTLVTGTASLEKEGDYAPMPLINLNVILASLILGHVLG
jgi:hypothetical protein